MRKRPNRAEGEEREAAASRGLAPDGPLIGKHGCLVDLVADCMIYRLAKYLLRYLSFLSLLWFQLLCALLAFC